MLQFPDSFSWQSWRWQPVRSPGLAPPVGFYPLKENFLSVFGVLYVMEFSILKNF